MAAGNRTAVPPAEDRRDSQTVVHNSVTVFVRQVAIWVLNAVLILFLPRYLGDQGLGQLQFAISFVTLFSIGVGLGIHKFLVKEVARDHSQAAHYLSTAIGLALLNSLVVLAVILSVVQFMGLSSTAERVVFIAACAMVFTNLARLMAAFLHGFENMDSPAVAEVAGKVFVVTVGIIVLLSGLGVMSYALVLLAGAFIHFAVNARFLARDVPLRINLRPPLARTMLVGGVPFLLMGVLLEVYAHTDVVMLRFFTSEAVVGWYAAARQLYMAVEVFPLALTTALLPTLARVHMANTATLANIARKSIGIGALVVVPMSLGLSLLAEDVIAFLPYPSEFRNSVPLLTILALSIPPTTFLTLLGTIVIAIDRQRVWATALSMTVFFNVALNIVAIPYFQSAYGNGAIGASLATLVCELFMVVLGVKLMPAGVINADTRTVFLKTIAAGAVMMTIGVAAKWAGMPVPIIVAVSAVTYLGLVFGLRAVTHADILFMWEAVRVRARRDHRALESERGGLR
jgi:O-antigen/teichoic acid export membrane protein